MINIGVIFIEMTFYIFLLYILVVVRCFQYEKVPILMNHIKLGTFILIMHNTV